MQAVALVLFQVNVELAPLAMLEGAATSDTVGLGGLVTVTVALAVTVPPVPLQESEKPVVVDRFPVEALPLTALVPLQPPDAIQLVALVLLQVNVELVPLITLVGTALSATVGAGLAVTVTIVVAELVPPKPVHKSVKVLVDARAPVDALPLND